MLSKIAKFMIERPSSIREIMELVAEFERHPEKFPRPLIYLAGGWPQDAPPKVLQETMREVLQDNSLWIRGARYSPTIGFPEFIDSIINYEKEIFGRKIDAENIMVGLGSTEQTAAIFRLLLDPEDEIILTRPGYLNYTRQLELELTHTVKMKFWSTIKDGAFNPDIEELKNMLTNRTKIVLITSPGNPDGQIWDEQLLKAIGDLAEDHNFFVVIDAAYRAFKFYGTIEYSRSPGDHEIWICSFSKELRAPGWRISYVILPSDLRQPLNTIEQARVLAPVSLMQVTLAKLFTDNKKLQELRDAYESGREKYRQVAELTVELLNSVPEIKVLKPQGGFYVFFDISKIDTDDKKVWRELIDLKQLALAPGTDFNGARGWIRLSFAPTVEEPQKLKEGIERLKEYVIERKSS